MKEILHSIAHTAKLLGILDNTAYRNKCIRIEFEELKKTCVGETVETIIQKICDKYHLGSNTIREIVYDADEFVERLPKMKSKKIIRRSEPRRRI